MPQSALIVDDSRTALVTLGRMLAAHGVQAEHAESGPEALEYLRQNSVPDMIFLDHMMPGMDGFETLAALKADARTAVIPVVMYTSQEGEAYMGQALAKGAIAILRKPVDPTQLVSLLARVERARVMSRQASRIAPPVHPTGRPRAAVTGVIEVPAEFRRTPAARTVAPSAQSVPIAATRNNSRTLALWAGALVSAVLATTTYWFYQRAVHSEQQRALLQQELTQLQLAQAAATHEQTITTEGTDAAARPQWLETLAWSLNQHNQYGWNEEPLGDARLSQARELVARLAAAGFRGSVRFESHLGEFCLARDEQGQLRLPVDTVPFTRCEVITYPPAQALLQSGKQSAEFARFVAQTNGPVRVVVAPQGASKPLVNYPSSASVQTAGDWNAAARMNNRVEIVLVPSP